MINNYSQASLLRLKRIIEEALKQPSKDKEEHS